MLYRIDEVIHSKMVPQQSDVPRQIWTLWVEGVEHAPPLEKTCLWSHEAANPTFTVSQLDLLSAINMTNVLSVIPKSSWDKMSKEAKSDVIRVFLLHKYGGVWADATLCMIESLDHWLQMDLDFTTFIRHDKKAARSKIKPWISSWFMVSRPGGDVITALRDSVIKFWKDREEAGEYYWLHRLFSNIMSSNGTALRNAFDPRTAITADPFHCEGLDKPKLPEHLPMFMINECNKDLQASVLQRIHDLFDDAQVTAPKFIEVPHQIWALWDKGVENAPPMEKTCLWSHKAANPTFIVNQLDLQSAIKMTDVFSVIAKSSWDKMSIQAKSDIIRVLLLHKYGGVWADATLCMIEGLEHWLHMDLDFTTFIRHDKKGDRSKIKPWITSWFMVSRPGGMVITALRDSVIKFWKDREEADEYFWLHRLFSIIMSSNGTALRGAFDPHTAISADPFHCKGLDKHKLPEDLPMFKITAEPCTDLRESILQRIHDLYGDAQVTAPTIIEVPRQIWGLWDVGVENAPPLEKTCLWSHKVANPTFTVTQLDLQSAINMTDLYSVIAASSWNKMSIEAKSDVIRVFLLHKYGGVWADATLCMVEGLEHWLHMDLDFTTFVRHDKRAAKSSIKPWISSWFMVSRPGGQVITALRDSVIKYWKDREEAGEYYWLHRLFSNIMSSNATALRSAFDPRTAITADSFHCQGLDKPKLPEDLPMFKISKCNKHLRESVFQRIHDLIRDSQGTASG